jgi:hypothetical protein
VRREIPPNQSSRVLAVLFFFYGIAHLVAASFVLPVILALAHEGYINLFRDSKAITLLASTLSMVVMPLLSGYALLLNRLWAKGVVIVTGVLILIVSVVVLRQILSQTSSPARVMFVILYGGGSVALCIYGFSLAARVRT